MPCACPRSLLNVSDIRRIRKEANVSQAVFAAELNVGKATVAAWQQSAKQPSGAAPTLLDLVERTGLSALAGVTDRSNPDQPNPGRYLIRPRAATGQIALI